MISSYYKALTKKLFIDKFNYIITKINQTYIILFVLSSKLQIKEFVYYLKIFSMSFISPIFFLLLFIFFSLLQIDQLNTY